MRYHVGSGNEPPNRKRAPLCFVSHSWKDEGHQFAKSLCDELRSCGIEPWLDEQQIPIGADLRHTYRYVILERCEVFMAIVCPAWRQSVACQEELTVAAERREREGLQIVPVLRQDVVSFPDPIQGLLHLRLRDLNHADAIRRLASSLHCAAKTFRMARQLQEGTWIERQLAVKALGMLGNRLTISILARCLQEDSDPITRYWAAISIGKIDTNEGCRTLIEALKTEQNAFVREGIKEVIARVCKDTEGGAPTDQE